MYKVDSIFGMSEGFFMYRNMQKLLKDSLGPYYKLYTLELDSVVKSINYHDSLNTRELLRLTRKYGFPSNQRLGKKKAKAYMIFVHSPKQFHREIEDLINKEFEENRIDEYKRQYILWHINGRKGLPPVADKNGELIQKN